MSIQVFEAYYHGLLRLLIRSMKPVRSMKDMTKLKKFFSEYGRGLYGDTTNN